MTHPIRFFVFTIVFLLAATVGVAQPTIQPVPFTLNGAPLDPPLSVVTTGVAEPSVDVRSLERFGVDVQTGALDPTRLRLRAGTFTLEFSAAGSWLTSSGEPSDVPAPVTVGGATLVSLRSLEKLGFKLEGTALSPNITSPGALPTGGLNQVMRMQASRKPGAVALAFAREPDWTTLERSQNRLLLQFRGTAANNGFSAVGGDGLSRLRIWQSGLDTMLDLELTARAEPKMTVATGIGEWTMNVTTEAKADLPPSPRATPPGVTYGVTPSGKTKLHLVTLDPAKFKPRVLTAPWGGALDALEYLNRFGAVAVMNGGYFDPPTLQPVDYLVSGGQTLAYWRGSRAGVGFTDGTPIWGAPRSRLTLEWAGTRLNVNSIQGGANPKFLTLFQGDGFAPVGGLGYITLSIAAGAISAVHDEAFTPAPGEITLTFNPSAFPTLIPNIGDNANITLTSGDAAWAGVTEAIAAGPRLVKDGAFAVNPEAEGFDPNTEIWRSTRQVGFGTDAKGWYVLAMLELGTPEEFARALVGAGLRDAVRMDSGSSAQIALASGMIGARWARTVPNALAFVPR